MDWSLQADIWQRAFNEICKRPTKGSHVVVTEPMFNFRQLQESMCQTLFEDLGVASFVAGPPPAFGAPTPCRSLSVML